MEFDKWYKCHFAPGTVRAFWRCIQRLFGRYNYVSCIGDYTRVTSLLRIKNFPNYEATYYICFKAGNPPLVAGDRVYGQCEGEITNTQAIRLVKESYSFKC